MNLFCQTTKDQGNCTLPVDLSLKRQTIFLNPQSHYGSGNPLDFLLEQNMACLCQRRKSLIENKDQKTVVVLVETYRDRLSWFDRIEA